MVGSVSAHSLHLWLNTNVIWMKTWWSEISVNIDSSGFVYCINLGYFCLLIQLRHFTKSRSNHKIISSLRAYTDASGLILWWHKTHNEHICWPPIIGIYISNIIWFSSFCMVLCMSLPEANNSIWWDHITAFRSLTWAEHNISKGAMCCQGSGFSTSLS